MVSIDQDIDVDAIEAEASSGVDVGDVGGGGIATGVTEDVEDLPGGDSTDAGGNVDAGGFGEELGGDPAGASAGAGSGGGGDGIATDVTEDVENLPGGDSGGAGTGPDPSPPQPPGAGPETIDEPAPTPDPAPPGQSTVYGPGNDPRLDPANRDAVPTVRQQQGLETARPDEVFKASEPGRQTRRTGRQARAYERAILRRNPGLDRDDVAVRMTPGGLRADITAEGRASMAAGPLGVGSGDIAVAPGGRIRPTTERGENALELSAIERNLRERYPGAESISINEVRDGAYRAEVETGSGRTVTQRIAFGGAAAAAPSGGRTQPDIPTEIRGAPQTAAGKLDEQLDQQFGTDLQPGEDYTVTRTRGPDGRTRLQAELTDEGQIKAAGVEETGETYLDRNVINPALDAIGFQTTGDEIQELQADLRRNAAIHRTGRGVLPSGEQAEAFGTKYAAPGVQAVATVAQFAPGPVGIAAQQFASEEGAEAVTGGFYQRAGETINPDALVLGAGKFVEGVGEYAYESALSTLPADRSAYGGVQAQAPGTDQTFQEVAQTARQNKQATEAAAGAAAAKLVESSVRSARQNPRRTVGAGLFEAGTVLAGEALSPVRVTKLDVPTGSRGSTTVRGVRLETPRAVRAATGRRSRGRTLAGTVDGRPTVGRPSVDVRRVDFERLEGQGATTEAITPFETDVFQASAQRYGGAAARRSAAQERVARVARGTDDELILTRTEDIVREVESVPRDRVAAVARALEDIDGEIYGSAAVRAQFPNRARKPGDLDLAVRNEARAKAKLGAALQGSNAELGDVFDFSDISDKARPGQPVKLGRMARERLETEEGVAVTRASEEFVKKTGAAGFLRGPGSPRPQDVGRSTGFDIGPEPIREWAPPRYKDVGDVSTLGRLLVAEESERGGFGATLRRRRTGHRAAAVEEFEREFAADIREVPATRRPDTTPDLPETGIGFGDTVDDIRANADRFLGEPQRAQFTLVDAVGGGRRAADDADIGGRLARFDTDVSDSRLADRLGVGDDVDDAARRADSGGRSPSGGRRAADDAFGTPGVSPSSSGGGRADTGFGLPSSSPGSGRLDERLGVGSYSPRRDDDSGGFPSTFGSGGGGGPSPGYGGGGDDGVGGGGGGGQYAFDDTPGVPIPGYYNQPGDLPSWSISVPGKTPDRDREERQELDQFERRFFEEEPDAGPTPIMTNWRTENTIDSVLGGATLEAQQGVSEAQAVQRGTIEFRPFVVEVEGTRREQAALEAAFDFFGVGDGTMKTENPGRTGRKGGSGMFDFGLDDDWEGFL